MFRHKIIVIVLIAIILFSLAIYLNNVQNKNTNDNNSDWLDSLNYPQEHIIPVSDKQYYVDNMLEITLLSDNATKEDLENLVSGLGKVSESNDDSCDYILQLNKSYKYSSICMLEDKLNKNEWLLASVINIYDTSDWYRDPPMN